MNDGIEQTEAQVEAPEAPKWEPEVEHEAKALGWKSPDEWAGEKPPGYIDNPNDYLKRAESFTPFRRLREKMTEAEKKADDRLRRLESVAGKALERQKADSDRQIAELKAAKLKAVETGDVEEYRALDKRQADIEAVVLAEPEPAQESSVPAEHKAALDRWVVGKDWFRSDPIMTQAAVVLYGEAQKMGLTDPGAILAHVDAKIAEAFPHKFAKAKDPSPSVEAGLTFGGSGDQFSKLPADARDAFRHFVAEGLFEDTKEGRAIYAKDYNNA